MYESKIELCNLTRVFLGVYVKCSSREGIKLIDACSDPVLTINIIQGYISPSMKVKVRAVICNRTTRDRVTLGMAFNLNIAGQLPSHFTIFIVNDEVGAFRHDK